MDKVEIDNLISKNPKADPKSIVEALTILKESGTTTGNGYNLAIPYSILVRPTEFEGENDPKFVKRSSRR